MTFTHMYVAWKEENLDPIEKLLLLYLCDQSDQSGFCQLTFRSVKTFTNMTNTEIHFYMLNLQTKKLISIEIMAFTDCFQIRVYPGKNI